MHNAYEGPEAPAADDLDVQAAFVKQRPLYINVLDDLGSGDCFVVDGDCLLLQCLASPSLDLNHGGQMLHLTYLIEDFLHSLKACLNSRFNFVFFEHHAAMWSAQEQDFLLMARHILQQHLEFNLQQDVKYFPSWHSDAWQEYVQQVTHGSGTMRQLCVTVTLCPENLTAEVAYMLRRV